MTVANGRLAGFEVSGSSVRAGELEELDVLLRDVGRLSVTSRSD